MSLKDLLRERGIEYRFKDVEADPAALAEMKERTGKAYVPQVFIGDEYVGGYENFLLLNARGEIDRKLGREPREKSFAEEELFDVLIIGGGPAGLTAAAYASRKNLRTALITEELGGQPMWTSGVENYMGFQYITGPELMSKFEQQIKKYPVEVISGEKVARLENREGVARALTRGGKAYRGRTVIVASGKRSRQLNIPGEKEYAGRGVSYCATCDGPVFKGQPVLVAGGGNSAMQAALELAEICPSVQLVSLTKLTGDEILRSKVEADGRISKHLLWQPVEIKGNSKEVQSVIIASVEGDERRELAVSGVFIEAGLYPNSSFVVDLLQLNSNGEIVVDCEGRTGVKGVFAAGDVTQVRDKQIVVAAGEGAKAALSAHDYLLSGR
ncbi:MAG: FAD-dependent oxidoreductase [Thermoleophilia bacterium]